MRTEAVNPPKTDAIIFESSLANKNDVELRQTFLIVPKEIISYIDGKGFFPLYVQSHFQKTSEFFAEIQTKLKQKVLVSYFIHV